MGDLFSQPGDILQRPLLLSDRFRPFELEGRSYAHASQVPLSYLAASSELMLLLQRFARPQRLRDAMGLEPTGADREFFSLLHRVGLLLDADHPDPVHGLSSKPSMSRTLLLFPTNACNLRCIYCYATSGPNAGPKLKLEQALEAVEAFFGSLDSQVKTVVLQFHGGGEPTTHFPLMAKTWERFHQLAQQRHLAAYARTITNGVFGREVLRALQEPHWQVTVSYDGPRQGAQRPTANHRDIRAKVIANLCALRQSGKRLSTRATLTRSGVGSMRELVEEAQAIGIARVQVEPASIVGRGANLMDGPPDPLEFAEAFMDAFPDALRRGVELSTSAWSHTRVGNGRFCAALMGTRALTPDGFISACTEVSRGLEPNDPFLVGIQPPNQAMEIWPEREAYLQRRIGYSLPHCQNCLMVDTCGGGCPSRSRAQSGSIHHRDEAHCIMAQHINPRMMADLADGKLGPDLGWQPITAELIENHSALPGAWGRLVALVPPFARASWNAASHRRPIFPVDKHAPRFFHLATPDPKSL